MSAIEELMRLAREHGLDVSVQSPVAQIMAEHRLCGPVFDGCYAHYPWDHCRADGMAWPCDVDAIRVALVQP